MDLNSLPAVRNQEKWKELASPYDEALVSVIWMTEKLANSDVYRRLIFASVEMLPVYWNNEPEIPEQGIKAGKNRLFFIRRKIPAEEALAWYAGIAGSQSVEMFWQKGTVIHFFAPDCNDNEMVNRPVLHQVTVATDSPIVSEHWGAVRLNHFMTIKCLPELERQIGDASIVQWINERLMWDLSKNRKYLGSVNLILPNPRYGKSSCKLKKIDGEREAVTVTLNGACFDKPLKLFFCEKIGDEISGFREYELCGSTVDIPLAGIADYTAYVIVDSELGLIDYSPFTPYIRKIITGIRVKEANHIIEIEGEKSFEVEKRTPLRPSILGADAEKECPELQLTRKNVLLEHEEQEKDRAANQHIFLSLATRGQGCRS